MKKRKKYISEQISSCNNSKQLYSILDNLTCKNKRLSLPSDTPKENLPNAFNEFFIDKISKLRNALDCVNTTQPIESDHFNGNPLYIFEPVTNDYVKNIIMKSKKKVFVS